MAKRKTTFENEINAIKQLQRQKQQHKQQQQQQQTKSPLLLNATQINDQLQNKQKLIPNVFNSTQTIVMYNIINLFQSIIIISIISIISIIL
jgi:hypothetical protein